MIGRTVDAGLVAFPIENWQYKDQTVCPYGQKNSCGVSVGVFLQPVSSIYSSPLKNLRFIDTASLDEYFDHAGTGSWEDARKCLCLLVGRTGIELVVC